MIYLWEMPKNCTNKLIAEYDKEKSPDRFLFRRGNFVPQDQLSQKAIFYHDMTMIKIGSYDCIPNNSASPLVNEKIIDILNELCPDDFQLIDTEVHCKDGILTNYKLLNIISTIIGFDYEKSVYRKEDGYFRSLTYATYKKGCMGQHQIARDKEYLGHVLVTEALKLAFEHKKIKGSRFVSPEEFYIGIYGHPS